MNSVGIGYTPVPALQEVRQTVALVLQLLFPCAAGRGRAALELVPHREHPLDDLEILRAAPVVEGEAAAVEDLAHGEREDLEALDEGLVVRVVDVDDHDPDGLSVAAGGCTANENKPDRAARS